MKTEAKNQFDRRVKDSDVKKKKYNVIFILLFFNGFTVPQKLYSCISY